MYSGYRRSYTTHRHFIEFHIHTSIYHSRVLINKLFKRAFTFRDNIKQKLTVKNRIRFI